MSFTATTQVHEKWNGLAGKWIINDTFKYYNRKSMSIPGVINMHNVFHNPAQYNYASLFQNTLALAFSKAHNTCLFGLSPPPKNDKEAAKMLFNCSGVGCGPTVIWSCPQTSRDQNWAVKLPVLTKWLCVSLALSLSLSQKNNLFIFKLKQMFRHNLPPNVHFYALHVLLLIVIEGLGRGLISVYCNMSTNHWLPPSVCAVTSGSVQDFPSFLKDAG